MEFDEILKMSNRSLVFKEKTPDNSFKIALVTQMHPALPNIKRIFDQYYPIIKSCPFSSRVFPRESLISSHRKLADLSSLLAGNPFYVPPPNSAPRGFVRTLGCKCKICKEGYFTSIVNSPSVQDRGFVIPSTINCRSVNVVYLMVCFCGKHYVGKTTKPKDRWRNHKSHIRCEQKTCNMATHCIEMHREMVGATKLTGTDEVKSKIKFTLLQSVGLSAGDEELKKLENKWRDKLQSWAPMGLNTKDD